MKPSAGRIVHYRLTADQAFAVNRRRTDGPSIAARMKDDKWPQGAQAHVGNIVHEGEVFPMVIVVVWPDEFGPGKPGVNGQAFLDGNDSLWVTSAGEGTHPGQWCWPERVDAS